MGGTVAGPGHRAHEPVLELPDCAGANGRDGRDQGCQLRRHVLTGPGADRGITQWHASIEAIELRDDVPGFEAGAAELARHFSATTPMFRGSTTPPPADSCRVRILKPEFANAPKNFSS